MTDNTETQLESYTKYEYDYKADMADMKSRQRKLDVMIMISCIQLALLAIGFVLRQLS